MRIAICEDEISETNRITEAIKDWAQARKVNVDLKCFDCAESFIMAWPDATFDLAFLDIHMKNVSGIQLAGIIRKQDKTMHIVFVTGYEQYAIKGYDVNALHYLIKPLSPAKLIPVLDKAYSIWRTNQNDYLLVSSKDGQYRLPLSDIYYISMDAHNAQIYTDEDVYIIRKTVSELKNILPAHFIQCHRSYIVNLLKIDCLYKDSLRLSNDTELPVSRSNSKTITEAFMHLHMGSWK